VRSTTPHLAVGAPDVCVGVSACLLLSWSMLAWDDHVLPNLEHSGWLPDYKGSLRGILKSKAKMIDSPWATPLTASNEMGHPKQLPSLNAVLDKPQLVGKSKDGLVQYIRALPREGQPVQRASQVLAEVVPTTRVYSEGRFVLAEVPHTVGIGAACMPSQAFTDVYEQFGQGLTGHDVWVCKVDASNTMQPRTTADSHTVDGARYPGAAVLHAAHTQGGLTSKQLFHNAVVAFTFVTIVMLGFAG